MEDKKEMKQIAVKVLGYLENATSFAASIDPMFGIVSSVVGAARKGLEENKGHHDPELDKDFKEIHSKLREISERNHEILMQIRVSEVNENLKDYEERIKHQYNAFTEMIERVKKDQANAKTHMDEFESIYKRDHSEEALQVYYNNVATNNQLFGRPVLEVYMDACDYNQEKMEQLCLHFAQIFQKGIIALVAYTAATDDDVQQIKEKWEPRVMEIQEKFDEVLKKCQNYSF